MIRLSNKGKVLRTTVFLAVVFVVISCKDVLKGTVELNREETPVQEVDDMFIVQTDKGVLKTRVESPAMRKFRNDTTEWDFFPEGVKLFAYDEQGHLETMIRADRARHTKWTERKKDELWAAFGNVVIRNLIKKETMETDTLYWNQATEKIYTDCYVRLYSPQGMMQGYGMESDQRGRNAVILNPFNSYGIMDGDSTEVNIDSVNFIGPFPLKKTEY